MQFSNKFHLLLAICWLLVITILLVIPGSAFPTKNWMSQIQLDKWVHIFLFALLVTFWVRGMWKNYPNVTGFAKLSAWVFIAAVVFGICIEGVQHFFVLNRSFELNDIFADIGGSLIGYLWVRKLYKK